MIRVTGGGGGYPSKHWARGRNTPWNKSPIHCRAHTPFTRTLIPMVNLDSPTWLTCVRVSLTVGGHTGNI
uniref:Uncharacterized protein n=1 Tax=Anguilla anguilla TaxID=7936 RepID=A0A0E9U404_ANGAN